MSALHVVNTLLEAGWQPAAKRLLCHHNWVTSATDESQPGLRIITQTCPHCGKQRVLNRRILPKLAPKPAKKAMSKCHHIWIGIDPTEENPATGEKLYQHRCPKCGYIKNTIRRTLPPK